MLKNEFPHVITARNLKRGTSGEFMSTLDLSNHLKTLRLWFSRRSSLLAILVTMCAWVLRRSNLLDIRRSSAAPIYDDINGSLYNASVNGTEISFDPTLHTQTGLTLRADIDPTPVSGGNMTASMAVDRLFGDSFDNTFTINARIASGNFNPCRAAPILSPTPTTAATTATGYGSGDTYKIGQGQNLGYYALSADSTVTITDSRWVRYP